MFELNTYDVLMEQMLEDEPDGINTQEGTLIYNACAKMGLKLEEVYIALEYLHRNTSFATMDDEHIIEYAGESGIERKSATQAVLLGKFHQNIEVGSRFTLNDLNYIVIERMEDYSCKVQCETAGKEGNAYLGELSPITYIADWKGGQLTKILIPAEDEESIAAVKEKLRRSFRSKSFSGNRAAYQEMFDDFAGIGGCKIRRKRKDDIFIRITVIDSEFHVPSPEFIQTIQNEVDPEEDHGNGVGLAPIDHYVLVEAVEAFRVDITAHIEFGQGYAKEDLLSYIEKAVDEYFLSLAQKWEDEKILTVRAFEVIVYLSKIEGIVDATSVMVNGMESIALEENQIPVRGEIYVI